MTEGHEYILTDRPIQRVLRITLNRPMKRNALCNGLRTELFEALQAADRDEGTHVAIIRANGPDFCAGYDLGRDEDPLPFHTGGDLALWARHVVEGWMRMWDMSIPIIAQVHGHCLAGGTELASACDLVYVAEDAKIGYPPVRLMSPPDMQIFPWLVGMRKAQELMLTGDPMSGAEAAEAGFATRALSAADLEAHVLDKASRVARIPKSIQAMNKRSTHRAMEHMGMRAALRAGTELQALAFSSEETRVYLKSLQQNLTKALSDRDKPFGDYRTDKR